MLFVFERSRPISVFTLWNKTHRCNKLQMHSSNCFAGAQKKRIPKVLDLEELPLYREDWLGLASLDNQQKLHKVMLLINIPTFFCKQNGPLRGHPQTRRGGIS